MAEQDETQQGAPAPVSDQEWLQNYLAENQGQVEAGDRIAPPRKNAPSLFPLLAGAFILAAAVAGFLLFKQQRDASSSQQQPGDLGQAVVVASGLRGHLITESAPDKSIHYKLKIEPINLPEQDSFARLSAANAAPLVFNIRVLTQLGDAICGKQVVLPSVAAPTVPAGSDSLQRIKASTGVVSSLWAQGTLPCSPDQYARFSYWDFSTNFPTVADQDRAAGIDQRAETGAPSAQAAQPQAAQSAQSAKSSAQSARRRPAPKKPQAVYFLQGDDHISAFEPGRNILTVGPGRSFIILRAADLATAAAWADDAALVHYTCDPQANCALRRSGSSAVLLGRRVN